MPSFAPFLFLYYSYRKPGFTEGDLKVIQNPIGKQIFFAGEHTSPYGASVHGACESGLRVAQEIIQALD